MIEYVLDFEGGIDVVVVSLDGVCVRANMDHDLFKGLHKGLCRGLCRHWRDLRRGDDRKRKDMICLTMEGRNERLSSTPTLTLTLTL